MIIGFAGTPGSGKTYEAVKKIRLLVVLCGFDFPRDQTHTKRQK